MNTLNLHVTGLDCAEEVAILKDEVGSRPGVADLDFDVINARMTVTFDPERIDADDVIQAVSATGMKATRWDSRERLEETLPFWQRNGRLIMASASGAFLILGFMSHWIAHQSFVDALTAGHGTAGGHVFPLSSMLLYLGAIVTGAWYVAPKALAAARRLRPDMNLLMTVAVLGAAGIGEWFEAGTVAFLFAVALLLEQWSLGRARRAIKGLMDLSPVRARVVNPETGALAESAVEDVATGATIRVHPGDKIPLDGKVLRGESRVNQAPITGESVPVSKKPGDEAYAGTINGDGSLEIEVTRPANDTTLARIIHLVQEAQSRRAPSEQWVEKFARYYTPVMMMLALAIVLVPPLILSGNWADWLYRGLVLLVIACPCALVISTPVSIVSGLTTAARAGVLVKGGVYLEAAGRLRALAVDKTGTLTYGHPEVQTVIALKDHTERGVLETAASLEADSEHPLARAIRRKAQKENIQASRAEDFRAVKGKGAEATYEGRRFWIGSHRFMEEKREESPQVHEKVGALEDAGHSVVALGDDDHVCGLISIADGVREGAREAVEAIKERGVEHVVMLTGDNEGTARAVAAATSVDEYRAELLPEDKLKAVEDLLGRYGAVAMVGDGVNDAPAMARASFGIAMGAMGTDAAIETADVALMADDLSRLPWLIGHSRRTLAIVKQNIGFALGVKAVFVVLTLFGAASLWMAIAADMGASLLVIFNGLRLLHSTES